MKETKYTCPHCPDSKEKLQIVEAPLDYGDLIVELGLKTKWRRKKKFEFKFEFDVYQKDFYWCPNCTSRFPRAKHENFKVYKSKRPWKITKCILNECRKKDGKMMVYENVEIGDLYLKGEGPRKITEEDEKKVELLKRILEIAEVGEEELSQATQDYLKGRKLTGKLTLDQAGICNKCGIVVPKEVDWQ